MTDSERLDWLDASGATLLQRTCDGGRHEWAVFGYPRPDVFRDWDEGGELIGFDTVREAIDAAAHAWAGEGDEGADGGYQK